MPPDEYSTAGLPSQLLQVGDGEQVTLSAAATSMMVVEFSIGVSTHRAPFLEQADVHDSPWFPRTQVGWSTAGPAGGGADGGPTGGVGGGGEDGGGEGGGDDSGGDDGGGGALGQPAA